MQKTNKISGRNETFDKYKIAVSDFDGKSEVNSYERDEFQN